MTATATRERPILFSGEMSRAIWDGRKSQTRRVVKPQPKGALIPLETQPGVWFDHHNILSGWRCPYGQPGDRLWVRESWAYFGGDEYLYQREPSQVMYRATWDSDTRSLHHCGPVGDQHWRPSIHMPRWASRLTLEITEVRVQRLQEISEEDARAEGVKAFQNSDGSLRYRDEFIKTWSLLNAKRGFGWDTNPWVWIIAFQSPRITRER